MDLSLCDSCEIGGRRALFMQPAACLGVFEYAFALKNIQKNEN